MQVSFVIVLGMCLRQVRYTAWSLCFRLRGKICICIIQQRHVCSAINCRWSVIVAVRMADAM